ncbi:MAG: signal peptidase I [Woeseiaceae bacterium]
MSINLALILTLLTAFTGVVVLLDKLVWQSNRKRGASIGLLTLVEYSRSFFPVLLFVLVIRSFVFEPFRIPSGSMEPTLIAGDFIFVKKYSYGLRLPVTETKFIETGDPERGDVIVFRLPQDPSVNYIKRVVGLPGDVVTYYEHVLTVNGVNIEREPHPHATRQDQRYVEQLGDRRHEIQIHDLSSTRQDGEFEVPAGQFFVMGDNRANSTDSRFIGFIPEENLVGEAVRIWMHMDGWSWPRWERIGDKIQ